MSKILSAIEMNILEFLANGNRTRVLLYPGHGTLFYTRFTLVTDFLTNHFSIKDIFPLIFEYHIVNAMSLLNFK